MIGGTASTASASPRECPICYEYGSLIAIEPCGHEFHEGCVGRWMSTGGSCPFRCQGPISGPAHLINYANSLRRQERIANVLNTGGIGLRVQQNDPLTSMIVASMLFLFIMPVIPNSARRSAAVSALGSLCLRCAGVSIDPIKAASGALAGSVITGIALGLLGPLCEKKDLYKSGDLGWLGVVGDVGMQTFNSFIGSKALNHSNAATSAAAGTTGSVLLLLASLRKSVAG